MKILGREISIRRKPPVIGSVYFHKKKDPQDLIDYVIPQKVENGIVRYLEVYKDRNLRNEWNTATLKEFRQWFIKRKGA